MACGAIAGHITDLTARRGWSLHVHPLAPLLHNRPDRIAGEVRDAVLALRAEHRTVVVAFADCGTYGALDEVCDELDVPRLRGAHCYDVFGGEDRVRALFDAQPGTYLLTDFLVRSFRRTVVAELGLDRYPELREDYFRHYTRVVWLAQRPTPALHASARDAAEVLGLPLEVVPVGDLGLERELRRVLSPR